MYIRHWARSSVEFFCVNDIQRSVCTSTEISTKLVESLLFERGGYIAGKCDLQRWNGAFCFQLELRKQELIKTLEIMTLIFVSWRIRGIFYHLKVWALQRKDFARGTAKYATACNYDLSKQDRALYTVPSCWVFLPFVHVVF